MSFEVRPSLSVSDLVLANLNNAPLPTSSLMPNQTTSIVKPGLQSIRFSDDNQHSTFTPTLTRKIHFTLSELMLLNHAPQQMSCEATRSITQIQSLSLQSHESYASYDQQKKETDRNVDLLTDKIKKCSLNFEPFTPRTKPQMTFSTPLQNKLNVSTKKHLTPDGSIDPFSRFLLFLLSDDSSLLNITYKEGKQMILAACKTHPLMQRICATVAPNTQAALQKKRALVLTANTDHNGALNLSWKHPQSSVFYNLEQFYDFKYRRILDITTFCNAIDEETTESGPIDLLIIRAHGDKEGIQLDTFNLFQVGDPLPRTSCLQNLPPDATVVVDSCSTGKGGKYSNNFANYIAKNSTQNARIFSAIKPTTNFNFSKADPIEVQFVDLTKFSHFKWLFKWKGEDLTYKIDPKNGNEDSIITNIPNEYDIGDEY